jgi:hypothetical protein
MLYWYAPNGAVITMVPVGTAHVGCTVTLAVGAVGTAGTALTITLVTDDIQVGSAEFLAVTIWVPGVTPLKVVPAWYAPPILY